jgi:hypothetical protein
MEPRYTYLPYSYSLDATELVTNKIASTWLNHSETVQVPTYECLKSGYYRDSLQRARFIYTQRGLVDSHAHFNGQLLQIQSQRR